MALSSIAPPVATDHGALDAIMSQLERRYGQEPRLDRAFRIFMAGRVQLSDDDPTAGLITGDAGTSYWATVNGFCECIDGQARRCKHQLALAIAVQLRAVANAEQAPRETEDARAQLQRLCFERSALGARLCSQGLRPVDDPTWLEYGDWIAAIRSQIAS
jgi:hypothetical protein